MSPADRPPPPSEPADQRGADERSADKRGGFPLAEYDHRVRDMAKNLIHPAALYVVIQVIGLTRLHAYPWFTEPSVGKLREIPFFIAGFLGAWAVFSSTLLRDAGLKSLTVTLLVPLALATTVALFAVFPPAEHMTHSQFWAAALLLVGPGPIAWVLTTIRWYRAKRDTAALRAGGGES